MRDVPDSPTRIIVVDDENLRRLVAAYLESEGYDVREAADGLSAMRVFEEPAVRSIGRSF
jgi:DNA-binding response OmpR family regulator